MFSILLEHRKMDTSKPVKPVENFGSMFEQEHSSTRKKKQKSGEKGLSSEKKLKKEPKQTKIKQEQITDYMPVVKPKRKINRFNGMPEEEVILKTLPDHLAPDLDIVIVGINPGLMAAYIGHHYAGPGNHFWKCLYLAGLVPEPMNCYDDSRLKEFGIGFTNICSRTTRGSADLTRPEIKEGAEILRGKLKKYNPKIAVFNGKGIYEIFSGNKKVYFGKQAEMIEGTNTIAFVMPSSSARCAQLPRAVDKVPFFDALRKLRDHLLGHIGHLDDAEVTFPNLELKCKKEEPDFEQNIEQDVQTVLPGLPRTQSGSDRLSNQDESLLEQCQAMESKSFLKMLQMQQQQQLQQGMVGVPQALPVTTAFGHMQYPSPSTSTSSGIWQYPCTSGPTSYCSTASGMTTMPNVSLPMHGLMPQQCGQTSTAGIDSLEAYNGLQYVSRDLYATSMQQVAHIKTEPLDCESMHNQFCPL